MAENHLRYSVIAAIAVSIVVSYIVAKVSMTYCDGLTKSGYFPVTYKDPRGAQITAMVPMYLNEKEYRKTTRGTDEN